MKKWFAIAVSFFIVLNTAWAVELNKATQAELEAVKGIGPAKAKVILDERTKNGAFKSWEDFNQRVKGVGDKTVEGFKSAGFTVAGNSASASPAVFKAEAKKEDKKEDKKDKK